MSVHTSDVIVSIAQVAAGGTIVQGILAFVRRRSELRQLDTASDNVIVGTAKDVVTMLHQELKDARAEVAQMKKDHAAKEADFQRQITRLGEEVSNVRAQNAVMKAEIERLQEGDLT